MIVEIGSWKGKSTIWIANGSKDGRNIKVYAIDPHIGSSEHQKEIKKFGLLRSLKQILRMQKLMM